MTLTPYIDDGDLQLYHGDALTILRELPAGIAQTCITSPPYWGLRDYGTGQWTGGEAMYECEDCGIVLPISKLSSGCPRCGETMTPYNCDHIPPPTRFSPTSTLKNDGRANPGAKNYELQTPTPFRDGCGKCGAQRVDSQLGLEATPTEYVANMVALFREVRRVLRDDGTLWLNLGDCYSGVGAQYGGTNSMQATSPMMGKGTWRKPTDGLKPKDLVGIPWRVAFALQADGWYLRSDIIWSKPNPMPESVTDRPTKAHEYVFLFSKQPRYFYDADAIREPHQGLPSGNLNGKPNPAAVFGQGDTRHSIPWQPDAAGRNRRSVWTIPTEPFPEAHFATYPQALVRPCVLAGSRPGDLVLDPFIGSGTTALVARHHARRSIGIDLSRDYLELAAKRTRQQSLLTLEEAP